MRELIYTLLELERGSRKTCDFCSFRSVNNKSVNQIVTRIKANGELIAYDVVCENCKEKFENDELPKCERCGRLQTKLDFNIFSGKNICYCVRHEEEAEKKELPLLPHQTGGMAVFYETQINNLREEKEQIAEDWHKRQKQELLDEIERLKKENERLKKLTPQELLDKVAAYEKRIAELEQQNAQQTAQIEVKKPRFFSFGRKT